MLSGLLAVLLWSSPQKPGCSTVATTSTTPISLPVFCIRASIQTFFSGVGALDFKATAWLILQSSKNITELALESGYLASCGRTSPNTTCLRLSLDVRDNPQSCIL